MPHVPLRTYVPACLRRMSAISTQAVDALASSHLLLADVGSPPPAKICHRADVLLPEASRTRHRTPFKTPPAEYDVRRSRRGVEWRNRDGRYGEADKDESHRATRRGRDVQTHCAGARAPAHGRRATREGRRRHRAEPAGAAGGEPRLVYRDHDGDVRGPQGLGASAMSRSTCSTKAPSAAVRRSSSW